MEQNSVSTGTANQDPQCKLARRGTGWRIVVGLGLAVVIALGSVLLLVWYERDRPLREVADALKAGNNSEALKKVTLYLKDHPQDAKGLSLKGRVLVEIGQLSEAVRLFRRVGANDLADLHAWAKAHLLRQEWSDALPVLETILKLNPVDADALHEITACLSNLGQSAKAVEMAERMTKLKGHEARAYLQLGTLHENLGNSRSAAEAWGHVLEYSPNAEDLQVPSTEFYTAYGTVLLDQGRLPEAIEMLQESLKRTKTAEAELRLGNALQQNDQLEQATEAWKRAVELAPNSREAREALAEFSLGNQRFGEAREWLEPLLKTPKLTSSTTYLMQRICLADGDREASQSWRTRTAELKQREHIVSVVNHVVSESPDSYWSRAIRAYRFAESGNWHEAESMLESLTAESTEEPFIIQLSMAIKRRGTLPSLELLPIHHFR